jgi:hypothetical protein
MHQKPMLSKRSNYVIAIYITSNTNTIIWDLGGVTNHWAIPFLIEVVFLFLFRDDKAETTFCNRNKVHPTLSSFW